MDIAVAYGYLPHTTGVYVERALVEMGHSVAFVGLPFVSGDGISSGEDRAGFGIDVDVSVINVPDLVLFVDSGLPYFPRGLDRIAAPTAAYLIDVHQNLRLEQEMARFFDHVFVAQRDYLDRFDHPSVHWLPLACDSALHLGREFEKKWDVGFVGNARQDPERLRKLELVADHFSTNDYTKSYPKEEIAEVYSRSRIVFNCAVGDEVNMRVFEGMASGSLLVTERVANGQSDLFEDGVHFVEYSSDAEMIEKIRYYLDHENEREKIARVGQEAALSDHTYQHRCERVIDVATSRPDRMAPIRRLSTSQAKLEYARLYAALRLVEPQLAIAGEFSGRRWNQLTAIYLAAKGLARRVGLMTGATRRLLDLRTRVRSRKLS
ncbi:MAG: hypothetical protein DCC49_04570 [Acidobacteria bacterium]|nr:MAG: hypothetical protein DCC49_04570 [Acidobacteriota bacterium]